MVEQQIRTWDVLDQEVLDLLLRRRGARTSSRRPIATLAFADLEIPLGDGETDVDAEDGSAGAAGAPSSSPANRCSRSARAAAI